MPGGATAVAMAERVEIFEVGPRDGLQNEPRPIATAAKIALVDCLSGAGFRRIEVASFVSPRWVPQMADSAAVLAGIRRAPGVRYAALTPNLRGFEAARAAGADEVAVFGSASEGFSRANINATIAESLERFAPVLAAAREAGLPVRGYVSCVTDCPYDGPVAPAAVARVAGRLFAMGCYEVSLGDTIGRATPERVEAMLAAVLDAVPAERLAGHFHDTAGRALENVEAALGRGLRVFDAAVGGLGGCPYAPGAAGNVATEAVHARLTALGYRTGLDAAVLARAAALARAMRGGADGADDGADWADGADGSDDGADARQSGKGEAG
ncbi:MAG: hydroxymethylglutaryl-CoA lyase [Roseovarius sp.]